MMERGYMPPPLFLTHAIAHPRLTPPVARAKMQQSSRAMFDVTMVIYIDKVALTLEVL